MYELAVLIASASSEGSGEPAHMPEASLFAYTNFASCASMGVYKNICTYAVVPKSCVLTCTFSLT